MKKVFNFLTIAVLAVALMVLPAFAAETATVSVSTETAAPGETVTLQVSISEASFATYAMYVDYDGEALELTSIDAGAASVGLFSGNANSGIVSAVNSKNYTANGVLFTLTFKVLTTTEGSYPVSIEVDNVTAADRTALTVTTDAGAVVVECNHRYGEWTETKAPTCTEKGEETRICSICGDSETREVEAKGHSFGEWAETKAPTCTEKGEETRICSICGDSETREVEAKGHSFGEWAETKAPTCTEKGEETRTCSCGESETRDVEAIDHEWEWVIDKDPTTDDAGLKHEDCKNCDETRNEGTTIDNLVPPLTSDYTVELLMALVVISAVVVTCAYVSKRKLTH